MQKAAYVSKAGKLSLLFLIAILTTAFNCQKEYRSSFQALNTKIDVTLYTSGHNAEKDLDSLSAFFLSMENVFSISKAESEVSKINHRTDSIVLLSKRMSTIFSVCRTEFISSGGLFDITVAPLKYLYGLESHQNQSHIPSDKELDSIKAFIGFGKILFISDSIIIMPIGMQIDLGGIGKGYIIGEAADFLKQKGYTNFLINTGGDIICSGMKPGKQPWIVGIRNPRIQDAMIATVAVQDSNFRCIFTSGDYERYFIEKKKRYHHIFDPRTCKPASHQMSVTVIGKNVLPVDAATKSVFIMPTEKSLAYLRSKGFVGLVIDSSGRGMANSELKGILKPDSNMKIDYF